MNISRKISSLFFVIAVALTISCETEQLIFQGPYFVRFTEEGLTQRESYSKEIKVEVHNAGPAPKSDVTVDYTVAGTAREGIDYVINGTPGKLTIKAGEYLGYISLTLINNSNNILGTQDVTFTLMNIEEEDADLRIGQGLSRIGQSFTLTIQDDCILGGNYYGVRDSSDVPIEDITITSLDCINYTLSNWDVYVFSFPDIRDLEFIDNGDNTITIPPQEEETLADEIATIDGSGVVDPSTRIITMTIRFVDLDGQPTFSFQLIPD